jgi:hypothetical protein
VIETDPRAGRPRWRGAPRGVRVLVAVQAGVLAYGGVVHVVQLATGGWPPYAWAPAWLAVYFASLTLFDPLAAGLLLAWRASGLYLGSLVLVTDAAANGYATYGLDEGGGVARLAQAVIGALALCSLLVLRRARPWMRRT